MQHSEVRIVKGVDDRLTGEAYVHIAGARAKLRLALSKDRTLMPVCSPLASSFVALCSAVLPLHLLCWHSIVVVWSFWMVPTDCDDVMSSCSSTAPRVVSCMLYCMSVCRDMGRCCRQITSIKRCSQAV